MGLKFPLKRKTNTVKLIQNYLRRRIKENQILTQQFDRLKSQLQNNEIDYYTYERLRDVLEMNSIKQREETLAAFQIFYI